MPAEKTFNTTDRSQLDSVFQQTMYETVRRPFNANYVKHDDGRSTLTVEIAAPVKPTESKADKPKKQ